MPDGAKFSSFQNENVYTLLTDQKPVKVFEYADFNHAFRDQHKKLVSIGTLSRVWADLAEFGHI